MKKNIKNMDYRLFFIVLILSAIGLVALWSANAGGEDFQKQFLWIGAGIVILIVASLIDYSLYEKFWIVIYIVAIGMLVGVLFTTPRNGARSWYDLKFMLLQPSEISKLLVIISLSAVISKMNKERNDAVNDIKNLVIILVLVMIPVVLIVLQPDYGTATTFLIFIIVMLFMSNIKKRYIIAGIALVIIALPLLYFFVLPNHAKQRIDVYLNPNIDPLGAGYNILQSKLAIGSGMLWGMGLGKGNQTQLGYLYPKTTDFIFAVISEEMGFAISILVIILFTRFLIRITNISRNAKDKFGALVAIGLFGMFLFYIVENIGMTLGVLPITGVPLPFVSYGGSSMISNMLAIGILLNISGYREEIIMLG